MYNLYNNITNQYFSYKRFHSIKIYENSICGMQFQPFGLVKYKKDKQTTTTTRRTNNSRKSVSIVSLKFNSPNDKRIRDVKTIPISRTEANADIQQPLSFVKGESAKVPARLLTSSLGIMKMYIYSIRVVIKLGSTSLIFQLKKKFFNNLFSYQRLIV